jgi:hypothetical protein
MHRLYRITTLLLSAALLAACAPAAAPMPTPDLPVSSDDPAGPPTGMSYDPQPGDGQLQRDNLYVDSTDLLILESHPLQFRLQVLGSLPTPCHQLRAVVAEPDGQNRIAVDLYALVDPNMFCVQVLEPFDIVIDLGSFAPGRYTLWLNNELVAEFDS